jgi:hypothetical protein
MVTILVCGAWYGTATDVDSFLRKYGLFCVNMCWRPQGLNALHVAVITNKTDVVRLLLDVKANPNQAGEDDDWTPLLLACRYQVRFVAFKPSSCAWLYPCTLLCIVIASPCTLSCRQ